jgi:hypothetical protein
MSAQSKPSIVFCHDLVLDVIRTAANAVQGSAAAAAL